MKRNVLSFTVMAAGVLVLLPAGFPGRANEITHHVAATAVCQPVTAFQGVDLRQRPLGIFNPTSSPVYVSCSLYTDTRGDLGDDRLEISFHNTTSETVDVGCVAQGGSRIHGASSYMGSVAVAAGASAQLRFEGIYRRREQEAHVNLSCLLPGGIEMGRISFTQQSAQDDL